MHRENTTAADIATERLTNRPSFTIATAIDSASNSDSRTYSNRNKHYTF